MPHKFREVTQANKFHVICLTREPRNSISFSPELRFLLKNCNLKGVEGSSLSKSFLMVMDLFAVVAWNLSNMQVCLYDLRNAV